MTMHNDDTQPLKVMRSETDSGPRRPYTSPLLIDAAGLSHRGVVRSDNQDHYLVARVGRSLDTLITSLPDGEVPDRFVWIGSRDGLTLYDGHSFVVFEHDASDPTSLSGNTIRTIYEDRAGNLWFGTNTGGLNRLDRSSWTFEHFRHDSADPRSISHDSVYAILHDQDGFLWVGTQRGLNRLDTETGEFQRFFADPDDPGSLSNDYVMTLVQDRTGRVWVGTLGGGLNLWHPQTETDSTRRAT